MEIKVNKAIRRMAAWLGLALDQVLNEFTFFVDTESLEVRAIHRHGGEYVWDKTKDAWSDAGRDQAG